MTWQLKFPKAHFPIGNNLIELELGDGLTCCIRHPSEQPGQSAVAAVKIEPVDLKQPTNRETLVCKDAYVRQNDLIATFPQADPWAFGYQVDVRVHQNLMDAIQGIEFWLSIHTSLLDANPSLTIRPMAIGPQWKQDGVLIGDNQRAAMMIHPLDESDCRVIASHRTKELERLEVFGGFMEKGVIRRARLFLAWSDSKVKTLVWQDVLQSFSESPLPLTV
jgi:hypothetical protein